MPDIIHQPQLGYRAGITASRHSNAGSAPGLRLSTAATVQGVITDQLTVTIGAKTSMHIDHCKKTFIKLKTLNDIGDHLPPMGWFVATKKWPLWIDILTTAECSLEGALARSEERRVGKERRCR